ncbi:MAG TPA: 2-hydroxyacid dehydrogenase, partial [Dehalococcoidia bacterium]|nr:2-hydroxyacid dehydrogenase [Dehalococcoidia bacterium]
MAEPKVVFFTALSDEYRPLVTDQEPPGLNFIVAPMGMDDDEKIELVKDADFLMLFPGRLPDRVMQAARKCRLIQVLSAGYDQINLRLANDLGIPVANNGGANSVAVAEHTIMLVLATYRRLLHYANYVKGGGWRPSQDRKIDVFEFEGKTLGLVGIGNIAQKVARRARAFDANLQYYDRYASLPPTEEEALGIRSVSLEELLRTSDVVSVHVPLTGETRHMIGKAELALMKPTSIIINTARGGIIDEAALLEALQSGAIAGAGLDVLEHEPPDPNDPLPKLDNVIVTPHTAG